MIFLVWHGIYIVRSGPYKNGKFKFKITFDSFPRKPPKTYFMSEVHHPRVQPETGMLILPNELS